MAYTRSASSSPRHGRQGNDGRPPSRPPSDEIAHEIAHEQPPVSQHQSASNDAPSPVHQAAPSIVAAAPSSVHQAAPSIAASIAALAAPDGAAPSSIIAVSSLVPGAAPSPVHQAAPYIAASSIAAPEGSCAAGILGFDQPAAAFNQPATSSLQLQDPPILAAPLLQFAATTTTPTLAAPIPPPFFTTSAAAGDGLLQRPVLGGVHSSQPGTHFGTFIPPVIGTHFGTFIPPTTGSQFGDSFGHTSSSTSAIQSFTDGGCCVYTLEDATESFFRLLSQGSAVLVFSQTYNAMLASGSPFRLSIKRMGAFFFKH